MNNQFIEYAKLHLISLEQDLDKASETKDYFNIKGQIEATQHLLSVAGIMS